MAGTTAEGSETIGWLIVPLMIGFFGLFVLFGVGIWRLANPANWAGPCPSCLRQGGHSKSCPERPPSHGDESWGERVAEVGFFALFEVFLGGED